MSSAPSPDHPSGQKKFEDPLEVIPVIKKLNEARKFIETRKAILEGEPLYLSTQAQLKERGYLGPWAFNAVQSLIDSIPGMLVSAALWVLFATEAAELPKTVDPVMVKMLSLLSPLTGPFTLLVLAYGAAVGSLPEGYTSKANLHAGARKYLYFDAAYGLWPQLFLATCIALTSISKSDPPPTVVIAVGGLGLVVSIVWQGVVTAWKVKEELFQFDYLADRPTMFVVLQAPRFKFYVVTAFVLPIVINLVYVMLGAIALLLTAVVHMLRV
jgi:hypothetical protein